MTNEWIEWKGGDCPIKSNDTVVGYVLREGFSSTRSGKDLNWSHSEDERSAVSDIVKYRIVEDHEPKETKPMTREQILAQIAELEKQLATVPKCVWANEYESGITYYKYEKDAIQLAIKSCLRVAVKYQEVIE